MLKIREKGAVAKSENIEHWHYQVLSSLNFTTAL
jgi:hypothetical protein